MKIEKQVKKSVKISLIFLAIGLLLGTLIAFAATPSSTIYISSGVYPGAPSFTVWREGSNYFAKDANGQLRYSGTNFSAVMQNCIDNGGEGLDIYLSTGQYVATNKIQIDRRITITGAGSGASYPDFSKGMTIIYLDDNFPDDCLFELIESTGLTNPWWQIPIFEKMMLFGNKANQAHQVNCFQEIGESAIDLQFRLLWFDRWNGHAINLTFAGQHRVDTCWFEHHNPAYAAITTDVNETDYCHVTNCHAHAPLFINDDEPYALGWHFVHNTIQGDDDENAYCGLSLNYTIACIVQGNTFRAFPNQIAIEISNVTTRDGMITNNIFGDGYYPAGDVLEPIHGNMNPAHPTLIADNRGWENELWYKWDGVADGAVKAHGLYGDADDEYSFQLTVINDDDIFASVGAYNATHLTIRLWDLSTGIAAAGTYTVSCYAWFKPE